MKTDKLFYGAAYYDEYMPYDRIDTDMEMLAAAGMNVIRIAESTWATWEPRDGEFDFTHLDRMLKAASEHGISVILGTPTYAIPSWMAKKYPDILAVTKGGQEIYGRRQNMDITSPDYRFHAERIIRKMLEHIGDCPCIIGYQIDNETTAYDTRGPRVQKLFREYLEEKFPDIEEFNREFGLDYWSNRIASWEDLPDVNGTINASLDAEFKRFQRKLAAEFIAWEADIINEYKRPDQFLTQNFCFDWRGHSVGIHPDIEFTEAAKPLTVAGVDPYHLSAAFLDGAAIHMAGAMGRSMKKSNYFTLETEAQGNPGWLPYDGQLRLQAFAHLACGSNMVEYWHWHSIHNSLETYWKGVLSHNLKENATYREVKRIGGEFSALSAKLKNLQKNCRVAVMQSNAAFVGLDEFPIDPELRYSEIFRWFMDALYKLNVDADIIYEGEEDLSKYDAVFVPALYSTPESTIERLREFTKNGGLLVASFKSFFCDEHLKVYCDDQPHGLTEVFGMTYDRFTKPTDEPLYLEAPGFSGKEGGGTVDTKARYWMELLEPASAKPVARYLLKHWKGVCAVTENDFGKGKAVYIGCYFEEKYLRNYFRALLKERDLLPSFGEILAGEEQTEKKRAEFPLVIKKGTNDAGKEITYLMNFSENTIRYVYDGPEAGILLGREFVKGKGRKEEESGCRILPGAGVDLPAWEIVILEA